MPTSLHLARELVFIEKHVAQQTPCPQPSLFVQRGPQEFVGAEMAFQQEVHVAIARHVGCDGCGIIRADKLCPGDQAKESERLRLGADFSLVADQHRNGNPEMQRAIGCGQGNLVVSRNYRNPSWDLAAERDGGVRQSSLFPVWCMQPCWRS